MGLFFDSGIDKGFERDLKRMNASMNSFSRNVQKQGKEVDSTFSKMATTLGAYVGVSQLASFGQAIVTTTAEFEKFGIVLENTLGSKVEADSALQMVSDFAAETPFALKELTGSFIKLTNQGFQPTYKEMVKLGDLASSVGKGFDQLSEAIIDAQVGEFERLKEFGVRAQKQGDQVTFTFKEQQTTVQNTSSAIQEYILSLGTLEGVAGANAKIAAALSGKISNLGDAYDKMLNDIGSGQSDVINDGLDGLAFLIENYETVGKVILTLVTTYGVYKASVIALNQYQRIQNALIKLNHKANIKSVILNKKVTTSNILMAKSFKRLKLAFAANPIGLLVTGLTLAIPLITAFVSAQDELTLAQKAVNEVELEAQKNIVAKKVKLNSLLITAKDETASLDDRQKAIEALNKISPEYLGNLTLATINSDEATTATEEYTKALLKQARIIAANQKIIEVNNQLIDLEIAGIGSEIKWYQKLGNAVIAGGNVAANASADIISGIDNRIKKEKELQDVLKQLEKIVRPEAEKETKTDEKKLTADEKKKLEKAYAAQLKQLEKFLKSQKSEYSKYNSDVEGLTDSRLQIVEDEYSFLTDQGKSYLLFLENLLDKEKDAKKQAIIKREIATVVFEDVIQNQQDNQENIDAQKVELDKLLKQYATYTTRKETLQKEHAAKITLLRSQGFEAQALEVEQALQTELRQLDNMIVSSNLAFQDWMNNTLPGIVEKGAKSLQKEWDKINLELDAEGLDPKQVVIYKAKLEKITQALKKINKEQIISEGSWKDTLEIINGVNELAKDLIDSFDGISEANKRVLTGITDVASGIINIIQVVKTLADATSTLEKASVILAAISIAMKVINSIASIFKKDQEAKRQAYLKEIELIHQANLELVKQNALYKEGNELFTDDKWGKALAGLEGYNTGLEIQQKSLDSLIRSATLYSKFRLGPGKDYEDLLEIYPKVEKANGSLDKAVLQNILNTKRLTETDRIRLENLITLINESEAAYGQFGDYISGIFGSMGDDITKAFRTMYETGDDAMTSLQGSFSDMIESFTDDAIEFALLQPYLSSLNDISKQLGEQYARGDISAEQLQEGIIGALGDFYGTLTDLQPLILEAYENADRLAAEAGFEDAFAPPDEDVTDEDLDGEIIIQEPEPVSTPGAIVQALTEETGDLISGRLGALMISNEQLVHNSEDALEYAIQNLVYMKQIKVNTDFLPEIAENTKKTYQKLEAI